MRTRLRFGLATMTLLALALTGLPAGADHAVPHPTKRTEQNYFTCAGGQRLQNVAAVQGQWPSWGTTAPSQSVQDGAGCGYYENLLSNDLPQNPYDVTFQGTFRGNLDSLTVDIHNMHVSSFRVLHPFFLGIRLQVDGVDLVNTPVANPVEIVPVEANSGVTERIVFSVTGLPFMIEDGDGTVERTFTLQLKSYNEAQSVWVWDTTEVPSGIVFNPATKDGALVPAG